MKTFAIMFALALSFLVASPSFALLGSYGVETVPPPAQPGNGSAYSYNPATGAPSEETLQMMKQIRAENSRAIAASNRRIGEAKKSVVSELKPYVTYTGYRIDELSDCVRGAFASLSDQITIVFAVMLILAGIGFVLAVLFNRSNHRHAEQQTQDMVRYASANHNRLVERIQPITAGVAQTLEVARDTLSETQTANSRLEELLKRTEQIQADVLATPQRATDLTVAELKKFDSRPIDMNVAGHRVVFHQSVEASAREIYQTLVIDSDVDDAVTPQTYHLHEVTDRNFAFDSIRRTMRDYFHGTLKKKADAGDKAAKLNIALIEYLVSTKQLEIKKIS